MLSVALKSVELTKVLNMIDAVALPATIAASTPPTTKLPSLMRFIIIILPARVASTANSLDDLKYRGAGNPLVYTMMSSIVCAKKIYIMTIIKLPYWRLTNDHKM